MKCAILIALYNAETTLNRTFESLQNQSFQDFRIVAIDDASQDTTPIKLERWQKEFGHDRFVIVHNRPNLGLTKSLNKGLELIHEPYTARIDADDWWHPNKLAKQIEFFDTHSEYGLVGTWYENHGKNGIKKIRLPISSGDIQKNIFKRNPFAHSAIVFRTELIKQVGTYNPLWRYGQDYELWLRLLPHTKMANIGEFLCYRNADDTLTARRQRAQMLLCVKTQLLYLKQYHRPWYEYRYILIPFLIALAPEWLRTLKRHIL